MLTGDIRNQIDGIWNDFWAGGVANPLSVIEQITYLLFIKRLDELHTLEERKSQTLKQPMERRIFPDGNDPKGRPYADLRWSRFKHFEPRAMMEVVDEHVFPFLRDLGTDDSSYGRHMRDARLGFSNPALLAKVVEKLDRIPMDDRDTKGDVYEYMLGKIASAGQNGQFRTPRHIIRLMVELTEPTPRDTICDPAAGTCGFLVAAGEYLREKHPGLFRDPALRRHFHDAMFHGYDFDATMLRIGSMNMILHGVENPNVTYRDSLAEDHTADAGAYSLVLANPPFAGSLDFGSTAKDLQQIVKTKKTELLFIALFLRLLKTGGRAAVIVPDGVLFGSSKSHKDIRRMLVEDHKLDAVIKLPSGTFRPYAGVSTAILVFTKTGVGGTDHVWFYNVEQDGLSLDDKRTPLLPPEKLGPTPAEPLSDDEHARNNLPDVLMRWEERDDHERQNPRTAQSFCVPRADIAATGGYDLSLNRYKEVEHEAVALKQSQALSMTMPQARFIIVVVGIILPYLARLPGGSEWLGDTVASFGSSIFLGVLSLIFFGALNAIAWGCLLALSFKYERPVALLIPCLIGFGFLAWAHGTLDLRADPQAAIALVVIPFYALVPIAIGGALGYVVDRILRRKAIT